MGSRTLTGINVLSTFDGISCGLVALQRAGIKVNQYFASEVDRYAEQISQRHHPNIIRLGTVINWRSWKLPKIDLLIGGPPCQGFSNSGSGLNFLDPRSRLFFEFADILHFHQQTNPNLLFMLENVKMRLAWARIISGHVGVQPIEVDSALLSAQTRKRLYWTNIKGMRLPKDRGIMLRDILIPDADLRDIIPSMIHTEKAVAYMNRRVADGRTHWDFEHHSNIHNDKSACITANTYKGVPYNVLVTENLIRKFHPVECERLQTLEDRYTEGVSDTQRYKTIGNGWTVDVIAHILGNMT